MLRCFAEGRARRLSRNVNGNLATFRWQSFFISEHPCPVILAVKPARKRQAVIPRILVVFPRSNTCVNYLLLDRRVDEAERWRSRAERRCMKMMLHFEVTCAAS